jgi:hypothetical protein
MERSIIEYKKLLEERMDPDYDPECFVDIPSP